MMCIYIPINDEFFKLVQWILIEHDFSQTIFFWYILSNETGSFHEWRQICYFIAYILSGICILKDANSRNSQENSP